MKIEFRETKHIYDEVYMGHKIFFHPCYETDTISATANTGGYTPLTAIARQFGWDRELIKQAAESCNARNEVAIVREVKPTLLLVPKTKTMAPEKVKFLTKDLLDAASKNGSEILHFTHFGFTQGEYPEKEFQIILHEFGYYTNGRHDRFTIPVPRKGYFSEREEARNQRRMEALKQGLAESRRETTIKKVVWDYDFRRWNSLNKAWRRLELLQDDVGFVGTVNLIFTHTKYLPGPH